MKISTDAKLRIVAGENIVMRAINGAVSMNRVISLNNSAAWLWKELFGKEFEEIDVAALLIEEYEIDSDVAQKDAAHWVRQMSEAGLLEK